MALQTLKAHSELQSQKEQVSRLQEEMSALQRKYERKNRDLEEAKMHLQAEQLSKR